MPRSSLLLLLILLAVGASAWLFLGGDATDAPVEDPLREGAGANGEGPAPVRVERPGTSLAGSPEAGRTRPKRPKWPVIPTDEFPRGTLEVTPRAPDDKPYAVSEVTLRLEREETDYWAPPLGVPDYETGVWRFENVPIGRLRVVLFGDHVVRTVARTEVKKDETTTLDVVAERGGAIHYRAKLYSGEAPKKVQLQLLDAQTKQPRSAYWQVREPDAHTGARFATKAEQGPDGYVFAIPPGRYVLRAESEAGEIDVPVVEVKRGETTEAEISLRR